MLRPPPRGGSGRARATSPRPPRLGASAACPTSPVNAIASVPETAASPYSSSISPRHTAASRREIHRLVRRLARLVDQRRPALFADRAFDRRHHLAGLVRTALDLAAFAAEDGQLRLPEKHAGAAMDAPYSRDGKRPAACGRPERIEHARERMDRRAQAKDRAQLEHVGDRGLRDVDRADRRNFVGQMSAASSRLARPGSRAPAGLRRYRCGPRVCASAPCMKTRQPLRARISADRMNQGNCRPLPA